jgi:hypothetical protein
LPGVSGGLCVGGRAARRTPGRIHRTNRMIDHALSAKRGTALSRIPRLRLSSSRPPRLGRSLRSRRMRFGYTEP